MKIEEDMDVNASTLHAANILLSLSGIGARGQLGCEIGCCFGWLGQLHAKRMDNTREINHYVGLGRIGVAWQRQ